MNSGFISYSRGTIDNLRHNITIVVFFIAIPIKLLLDILLYLYFSFEYNPIMLIAAPLSAIAFILAMRVRHFINNITLLFIALIFFMSFIIFYRMANIGYLIETSIVINTILSGPVLFLIYFVCGLHMSDIGRSEKLIIICSWIVSALLISLYNMGSVSVWHTLNENGSYLRIGDLFAILSLMTIAFSKKFPLFSAAIILVSAFVLYIIGSRSSILFYVMALVIYICFLIFSGKRSNLLFLGAILLTIILSLFFLINYSPLMDQLLQGRIYYTIVQSGNFGGLDTRADLFDRGIQLGQDFPIFGSLHERWRTGSGGDYIHSFLFVFADYGIFVFLILIILIMQPMIILKKQFSDEIFLIYMFSIFAMLFARAYGFPYIFLVIGLTAQILSRRRSRH